MLNTRSCTPARFGLHHKRRYVTSKDRRDGRARLDFTQNWRNRTLVAAYSPRPAPGLPVSAPIAWDELDDLSHRPDRWTIRTILERVETRGDLFAPALGPGQSLPRL